jgi:hypothetical protein
MTPFEAFREYLALKSHFCTKTYDYFKYNGKMKSATPSSYDGRRDKLFFMKLAKHKDPKGFLVSNFVHSDRSWIGDLAYNEEAQNNYMNWQKRIQSLSYTFSSELSKLNDEFDSNFIIKETHPYILVLYLRKEISIETLVILTDLARCISYWNKNMQGDPVWDEVSLKIQKYKPFMQYEKNKFKSIVVDKFAS